MTQSNEQNKTGNALRKIKDLGLLDIIRADSIFAHSLGNPAVTFSLVASYDIDVENGEVISFTKRLKQSYNHS